MPTALRRTAGLSLAVATLVLAAGCTSSLPGSPDTGTTARVTEQDFRISAPATLPAGDVTLTVHNLGPDAHELIVVRSGDRHLELRSDGLTVDEEGLEDVIPGALEPGSPGSVRTLRLHLSPGRYEFICNMAGHYLGGMHTSVVVR
jgi:hypothetical protein